MTGTICRGTGERRKGSCLSFVSAIFLFLLLCSPASWARPTSNDNIVKGLSVGGSFEDMGRVTDGDLHTYAVVRNALQSDNFIEIELKARLYIRQIKVYFEDGAYPTSFSIDGKVDAFSGSVLKAGVLPATYPADAGNKVVTVKLDNAPARSLRFNFTRGMSRGETIRIAEIEVYANMDVWPQALAEQPPIITDTEALLRLKSNLDFTGTITLEDMTDGGNVVQKLPTGVYTRDHAVFAHALLPGHEYRFRMDYTDFHGDMSSSDALIFRTRGGNLLRGCPVDGTFTAFQPDDPNYVKAEGNPLVRVNDGDDNYFTSMVTSREPDTEDQYIVFDLKRKTPVGVLFIFWRALAYSKAYQVDISDDAENWKTVLSGLDAASGTPCFSSRGDPMLVMQYDLKNVRTQYLRIFMKKGSPYMVRDPKWKFVQIMEVKAF